MQTTITGPADMRLMHSAERVAIACYSGARRTTAEISRITGVVPERVEALRALPVSELESFIGSKARAAAHGRLLAAQIIHIKSLEAAA